MHVRMFGQLASQVSSACLFSYFTAKMIRSKERKEIVEGWFMTTSESKLNNRVTLLVSSYSLDLGRKTGSV